MTGRVHPFTPDTLSGAQRDLYHAITSGPRAQGPQRFALTHRDGSLRGPFNAFLLAPELGAALQEVGAAVRIAECSAIERERSRSSWWLPAGTAPSSATAHEAVGAAAGLTDAELAALRVGDTRASAAMRGSWRA